LTRNQRRRHNSPARYIIVMSMFYLDLALIACGSIRQPVNNIWILITFHLEYYRELIIICYAKIEEMNAIDKLDFWKWAHSDFLSNAQRGILAEYIVGTALNCLAEKRLEWDAYDLSADDNIKIEVKSAAYIQSWKQNRLSKINFDIGQKRSWCAETNTYSNACDRSADIYVFCVLAETNRQLIDPLNTDQWFFMVAPTASINEIYGKQKTVGLSSLQKLGVRQVSFRELKAEINKIWVNKVPTESA
jgi:hypothetical protein